MNSKELCQKKKTEASNTECIKCPFCAQILILGLKTSRCFFGPYASLDCRKCGRSYRGEEN
jgi:hypothetical protein